MGILESDVGFIVTYICSGLLSLMFFSGWFISLKAVWELFSEVASCYIQGKT